MGVARCCRAIGEPETGNCLRFFCGKNAHGEAEIVFSVSGRVRKLDRNTEIPHCGCTVNIFTRTAGRSGTRGYRTDFYVGWLCLRSAHTGLLRRLSSWFLALWCCTAR